MTSNQVQITEMTSERGLEERLDKRERHGLISNLQERINSLDLNHLAEGLIDAQLPAVTPTQLLAVLRWYHSFTPGVLINAQARDCTSNHHLRP